MTSPTIVYGLGDALNDFSAEAFDLPFPEQMISQLNEKIGFSDADQFVFNLDGVSGVFGEDAGELNWPINGENAVYSYEQEISDDGLEGKFSTDFEGPIDEFWKENLGLYDWSNAKEAAEFFWNIDIVNMKAEFGYKATQDVVSSYNNEAQFKYDYYVEFEVEATDDSFELKINPNFEVYGFADASEEFGCYWFDFFGTGDQRDLDYESEIVLSVPDVAGCQSYFDTLPPNAECVVSFETSDLDDPIVLKLKNKFAFVKFDNYMAYVKSENFEGKMVSFAELPYLSFYYTENAAKQPFKTVRKSYDSVGKDLLLTIPVFAVVKEVTDEVMVIVNKWSEWGQYAIENPVKSAYWMDSMVHSVQPTTFDFSALVASTRFGCGQYPNIQLQEDAKSLANELYEEFSNADFSWLESIREFVAEVQAAEQEVKVEFALPA